MEVTVRQKGFSGSMMLAAVILVATGFALAGGAGCKGTAESCGEQIRIKYQTKGWLGIEIDLDPEGTVTIAKVYPGSPAETAGIQVGDQLVAMNSVAYTTANHEKLKVIKREQAKIGASMTYDLKRGAETLTIEATLAKIPQAVLSAMIDRHATEEHASARP